MFDPTIDPVILFKSELNARLFFAPLVLGLGILVACACGLIQWWADRHENDDPYKQDSELNLK